MRGTTETGLGFDLELDGRGRLTALGTTGAAELRRDVRGSPEAALRALDEAAAHARFVFGHNVWWHDLPWLTENAPDLRLLRLPAVDTLFVSTIAFAERPYHALLKDYKLVRDAVNDPAADARIAAQLLADAQERLRTLVSANPVFGRVVHALAVRGLRAVSAEASAGIALVFAPIAPPSTDLDSDLRELLRERACRVALASLAPVERLPAAAQLELCFAVAWLRVAGTHDAISPSVVMPWVRRQLPGVARLVHDLRERPCQDAGCDWCRAIHDPQAQLRRWFEYPDFRPEPMLPDGRSAQRAIVEAGFRQEPLLALLPTGGGKSLCFQLPAIQRYLRRGSLTVVISPLQSLMHDQVDNFLAKTGARCAVALTGRLTPPERRATLDAVRSGLAGVLYVAPEQLRNATFEQAIALREIGAWVFDEAHCLSKWGHDFRPDYLYAARFVREFSERHGVPPPPIVCVTATARPDVRDEILQHFRTELGQELAVFDGHAARTNLTLRVEPTPTPDKIARLRELVAERLAVSPNGSVLVYATTRYHAEMAADRLRSAGIEAEAFHAGLEIPVKKAVQERFLSGECRVVCATNAFGMGIDKPDIRLVVHFEIPGSLEAYVQEVGRAGRDGLPAEAVLMLAPDDIETQFRLAASSRLDLRDLRGILRRVRHLARPSGVDAEREAICTTGEILRDETLAETIEPSDRNAPTRVVTAIAWLERGRFLRRDENATTVFQGRPLVKTLAEAKQRIATLGLPRDRAEAWLAILARLIDTGADDGLSSDDFLDLPAVVDVVGHVHGAASGRAILRMLVDLQKARLLSTGVLMTAFVRHGVASSSTTKLANAAALEARILDLLRELEPDPDHESHYPLGLASLTQELALRGDPATLVEVQQVLSSIADRAQHAGPRAHGLRIRFTSHDRCRVQVLGTWDGAVATARRRHAVARVCLQTLLGRLPDGRARGASLLVEFSLEQLLHAIDTDLVLRSDPAPDPATDVEYALLFLHRIGAIVLHKGLSVFRQAMVLRVPAEPPRPYGRDDFQPLAEHQDERTVQIHAMHEYARRMVDSPADGLALLDDWFRVPRAQFLERYFPHRLGEIARATGPGSWQRIVGALSKDQRRIVEASENESVLVLAGPGSGKTRVVVHRCAWLLRVKRVPARAILVVCFNRSAALELRRRLRDLVGDDAHGVQVQTYHGMAARLVGRSPAERSDLGSHPDQVFDELMRAAVDQLETGNAADGELDGDDLRDRLLAGFRHILVDEYQDIDEQQYRLVSAIAGRTLRDSDRKLTVLAVGDDDQNIYEFRHTSVEFLRRFEADYQARRIPLVENYRSTAHILAVANALIAHNRDRLKLDAPVRVDEARRGDAPGGRFTALAHPARGRVHVVGIAQVDRQAHAVLCELRRLRACDPEFAWERCAVLSPNHSLLQPVRAQLEREAIPFRVRVDSQHSHPLFRLREVQAFLAGVEGEPGQDVDAARLWQVLGAIRARYPREASVGLVEQTLAAFVAEHGEHAGPKPLVREFFGELLLEQRRERTIGTGILLGTVHASKGTEHDHVIVLDGGWQLRERSSWEERRRLYYVGMTRARQTLTLVQCECDGAPWLPSLCGDAVFRSRIAPDAAAEPTPPLSYELLGQADLNLGFAGCAHEHERIARSIEALATGDPLTLVASARRVFVQAADGVRVAALSQAASERWRGLLPRVQRVRVAAVLQRSRSDEGRDFGDRMRRDAWHVVVPEITYRPANGTPA